MLQIQIPLVLLEIHNTTTTMFLQAWTKPNKNNTFTGPTDKRKVGTENLPTSQYVGYDVTSSAKAKAKERELDLS